MAHKSRIDLDLLRRFMSENKPVILLDNDIVSYLQQKLILRREKTSDTNVSVMVALISEGKEARLLSAVDEFGQDPIHILDTYMTTKILGSVSVCGGGLLSLDMNGLLTLHCELPFLGQMNSFFMKEALHKIECHVTPIGTTKDDFSTEKTFSPLSYEDLYPTAAM